MTTWYVRLAGADDADAVHELTQLAFGGYDRLDPPSGALRETVDVVREQLTQHPGVLVFDADGTPVGCARLTVSDGALHVRRIAVHPARQGLGVGRHLIAWVEQWAATAGHCEIRLGVRNQLPRNRVFYERLGYRPFAEHEFWVELNKHLPVR